MQFLTEIFSQIDLPAWLHAYGQWVIAVSVAAGWETPAVAGAMLAFLGVLPLPGCAVAIVLPALASDVTAYAAGVAFPEARFAADPLLPACRTAFPQEGAAASLYRLFPRNKLFFPFAAGQSRTWAFPRFLGTCVFSSLIWLAYALGFGFAMAQLCLALAGSQTAVWLRLAGFILLVLVIVPVFRYILWNWIDRFLSREKNENPCCRR